MSIRLPRAVWFNLVIIGMGGLLILALMFPFEYTLGRIFEADGQLVEATKYYQRWNEKHPEDYKSRWHTAELLLTTVNPAEALTTMEAMAKDWPDDSKILARLVEIEDSLLHVERVIPRLEALLAASPDDPGVLIRLSDHYRWFGDDKKLIDNLSRIVRMGDFPDERAEFLEILLANRQYDKLIEFYNNNMDTMANPLEARLALYEAYLRSGKVDEAIEELTLALALDPTRVDLLRELGDQLVTMNRWRDAIDLFKDRLTQDPGNKEMRAQLSEMYEITADQLRLSGQTKEAREQFYERVQLNPRSLALRLEYAELHGSKESLVAIVELTALLKLAPKNSDAWLALAERYSWSEQPEKAAEAYEKVHGFKPNNIKVHRLWANHLLWAKKTKEAVVQMRAIVAGAGTIADRVLLVEHLMDEGKEDEAFKVAGPLQRSENMVQRRVFAFLAVGAGRCSDAIPSLAWVTARRPKDGEAWYSLYECATTEGKPELALRALRIVKKLRVSGAP
ncbi:MAG: tetratricopeptide repeat protein [Kofleriaceae bacterium]|nr:tetratricopeptide repeat protein [Kofleriaceae bacterium]